MDFPSLGILGFLLCNLGFWPIFWVLAKRRGLGHTTSSMQRAIDAFRVPNSGLEKWVMRVGPLLVGGGAMLIFLGIFAMDASTNNVCRKACEIQGFEYGITRGSPHAERPQDTPRECWCSNGRGSAQTWAKEGIAEPGKLVGEP